MPSRTSSRLAVAVLALWLSACASGPEKELTEQELYAEARENLDDGNFITAQTKLQELETRFPFGRFSEQAQLDMMYAQMRAVDYPAAAATAARFLRQHPGHAHTDYALYIKGMANYLLERGVLENRTGMQQQLRDLSSLRESFGDFSTLATRFPDSAWAPDARARMLHIREQLAAQEVVVAWYYVRRGACVSAIGRARHVVENFPTSAPLGDALVILSECHRRLGEAATADRFLQVLKASRPDHPRLRRDGTLDVPEGRNADGPSWLDIVTFGLLG